MAEKPLCVGPHHAGLSAKFAGMICPACKVGIRFEVSGSSRVYSDQDDSRAQQGYDVAQGFCPECSQFIVLLRRGRYYQANFDAEGSRELMPPYSEQVLYPGPTTRPLEAEVPKPYREEFAEAANVLAPSPKASAALSRRILQRIFREELSISHATLAAEIDAFLARPGVPSHLSEAIDAVRNIGNFAAHSTKSTHTGEVVQVEPGEAEWLLEVLEALFDFVFVQPKRLAARRDALNQKLASVGKPPIKK
jgi:hypothetical protein